MNTRITIILSLTVAYFVVMTLIGYAVRKHARTSEGFTSGGRSFPAYLIGALLLSEFIGSSVSIGTAQKGFEVGISAAWNLVALALGFLLLAFVLAKKYKATGLNTLSAILAQNYGEGVRYAASLLTIFALSIVCVALYASGGAVLAAVLNIDKTLAIVLVGVVTVFYVSLGGMRSVVYTNFVHALIKYLGILLALIFALRSAGGIGALQAQLPSTMFAWNAVGWGQVFAWMIGGIGSIFATQYVIQALVSSDDDRTAKRACLYVSALMIPFGIATALIGMCSALLYPGIKSIDALPVLLTHMPTLAASLVVIGLAGSLFGGISAGILASATLAMKDFYNPWFNPQGDDRKSAIFIRVAILVLGLLPLILAMFADKLLMIAYLGKALRAALAVIILMCFYAPRFGTPRGALAGIILAVVSTIAWFLAGNPFGIDSAYFALVSPLLTMTIAQFLKPGRPQAAPTLRQSSRGPVGAPAGPPPHPRA